MTSSSTQTTESRITFASTENDGDTKITEADIHAAGSGHYQVVARRYRPKTFDELVGQSHISQALANALNSGRVGHAYLFTGARGVGKTSTARIFAKALNCDKGPTLSPCGVCDCCINVSVGEDIDVLEIDGASNRGIDEMRQLRQNASICPSRSRFKIYIIDEVHMLTREAFNALLKTLEEPPEHVKFIFCTTEPTKLPITILSRCQRFDFAGIETSEIADQLAKIAAKENVTAEEGVFAILARRAAGSMRDAQSLLEQLLSFAPEHIALSDVHDMLGTADDQLLFRLLRAMLDSDDATIFAELDDAASQGVDFGILTEQLMGFFRDLLVVVSGGDALLLLYASPTQYDEIKSLAEIFGIHRILASIQILDQTHNRMRYCTHGRILIELALIRLSHLDHFQMVSVLIDQLRSGTVPLGDAPSGRLPASSASASATANSQIQTSNVTSRASNVPAKLSNVTSHENSDSAPQTSRVSVAQTSDSSIPQNADLMSFSADQITHIWHEIVNAIPGILGTSAASCQSVSLESPNTFVATFTKKASMDFCEKDSARIQNALNQALGQAVRVRFRLSEAAVETTSAPASQKNPKQESREQFLAAAENPLVQQVSKLFDATLDEVRKETVKNKK
ncbi:MAG: DNA polymerase III subunit gamma/tau [Thermoguttaceae bacterium]